MLKNYPLPFIKCVDYNATNFKFHIVSYVEIHENTWDIRKGKQIPYLSSRLQGRQVEI
jgi:hypothetical protein